MKKRSVFVCEFDNWKIDILSMDSISTVHGQRLSGTTLAQPDT